MPHGCRQWQKNQVIQGFYECVLSSEVTLLDKEGDGQLLLGCLPEKMEWNPFQIQRVPGKEAKAEGHPRMVLLFHLVWFHLVSPSEDGQMESTEGDQGIVVVFHDWLMSHWRPIHQRGTQVCCHQRYIGSNCQ